MSVITNVKPDQLAFLRAQTQEPKRTLKVPLEMPQLARDIAGKTVQSLNDSIQRTPEVVLTARSPQSGIEYAFVRVNDKDKVYPIALTQVTLGSDLTVKAYAFSAPIDKFNPKNPFKDLKDNGRIFCYRENGLPVARYVLPGDKKLSFIADRLFASQVEALAELCLKGADDARNPSPAQLDEFSPAKLPADALQTMVASGLKGVPSKLGGPPWGDTLLCAESWQGRPVTATSDSEGTTPISVFVGTTLENGQQRWVPVEPPRDADFPVRLATVTVDKDTVYIDGGITAAGDLSAKRFSYDLKTGASEGFSRYHWGTVSLPEKRAMSVVAHVRGKVGEATVTGGGFTGQQAGVPKDPTELLFRAGTSPYRVRKSTNQADKGNYMPTEGISFSNGLVGTSTVSVGDFVFFGPGTDRDGKVRLLNAETRKGIEFPALPEDVGLGQLRLEGNCLTYSGGFTKSDKPNDKMWSLNLDDDKPKWKLVGRSDYLAGSAQVIDTDEGKAAVMVTPNGSGLWFLEPSVTGK